MKWIWWIKTALGNGDADLMGTLIGLCVGRCGYKLIRANSLLQFTHNKQLRNSIKVVSIATVPMQNQWMDSIRIGIGIEDRIAMAKLLMRFVV